MGKGIGMDTHRITAKTIFLTTRYSALFILPVSCVAVHDDDVVEVRRKESGGTKL